MTNSILITGGAGYIGTHIMTLLTDPEDTIVVLDNLKNGTREALNAAQELANRKITHFCAADLTDINAMHLLTMLFQRFRFTTVIHLAGLKSARESQYDPFTYYHTNIVSTLNLVRAMAENDCKNLIFSSSATVYAPKDDQTPCSETCQVKASNCYGRTKVMCEHILRDLCFADPEWNVLSLRYFNPVGAHPSSMLGENICLSAPEGLMPALCAVAAGRLPHLTIFGNNYNSQDGTAVRDFLHIMDLASGHIAAMKWLHCSTKGFHVFNLGTGSGTSILEILECMRVVTKKPIPCKVGTRRDGDVGVVYADVNKAATVLGWRASHDLANMCRDAWAWDCAQSEKVDTK